MKKRLLSILMCLAMVIGLLPGMTFHVHADYSDGANCPDCGHYHWDDYKCASCDACSDTCTHSDCYERNHPCPECDACKSVFEEDWFCDHCGMCFDDAYADSDHCSNCGQCGVFDICSTCGFCEWCAKNEFDLHCRECDACFEDRGCDASHPGDSPTHCEDCALICVDCGNCFYGEMFEYCFDCHMCNECAEGKSHCIMCGDCAFYADYEDECIADAADYFVCLSCCEGNGHHCSECGEHVGNGGPWCETGGDGSHCETCAQEFTCEQCGDCALCKGDELCEDCALCRTCCLENVYDEYGCVCDEYCTATIEDSDHLGECGHPTCTYGEICEYCGLCEQCCDDNRCEHGYCAEDPDQDDHICNNCGECFYEDELCGECSEVRCYDCCHERSSDEAAHTASAWTAAIGISTGAQTGTASTNTAPSAANARAAVTPTEAAASTTLPAPTTASGRSTSALSAISALKWRMSAPTAACALSAVPPLPRSSAAMTVSASAATNGRTTTAIRINSALRAVIMKSASTKI